MRSTHFINETSGNYTVLSLTDSCQEGEWFSGSISNHSPSFWLLPIFFPLFLYAVSCLFSCPTNTQKNKWGEGKDFTLGNVYCIGINTFQRKEHLPIFWDHRSSCLIPSHLWFALEYILYVLNAQALWIVNRRLIEKRYFYLYKLSLFHYVFS